MTSSPAPDSTLQLSPDGLPEDSRCQDVFTIHLHSSDYGAKQRMATLVEEALRLGTTGV